MFRNVITAIGVSVLLLGTTFAANDAAKVLFYNPNTGASSGVNSGDVQIAPDGESGGEHTASGGSGDTAYSGISNYYDRLANPGIAYHIELLRPGSNVVKQVSDRRVFRSGEKIRIRVYPNSNGSLHVLHTGSSGNQKLLPVSSGGEASINAGKGYVIPSNQGWLRFDETKGTERIKLVLTPSYNPVEQEADLSMQQVAALYDRASSSKNLVTYTQDGEKDLVVEGANVSRPVNRVVNSEGSYMRVSEDVAASPGSYAVNTAGEPVAIEVKLKHQ